jgi:8-oxo-dGTP diphosphatase
VLGGQPVDRSLYPALASEEYWPWGRLHVQFRLTETIPEAQVASVSLVAFEGDRVVLAQVDGRSWELPGGTREPGESVEQTARRELMEEAGAELHHFQPFGGWFCRSEDSEPYREHLPHPEFWRVVAWAETRRVADPTGGDDAETITAVESLTVADAVARLATADVPATAELVRLADELRGTR